jgi:hypothetical protein
LRSVVVGGGDGAAGGVTVRTADWMEIHGIANVDFGVHRMPRHGLESVTPSIITCVRGEYHHDSETRRKTRG